MKRPPHFIRRCLYAALFALSAAAVLLLTAGCNLEGTYTPGGYAVVYGVTQYDYAPDLNLPRSDAEAMAELFESQGYTVLLRIDDDNGVPASLEQLNADIQFVAENIEAHENFVFYFAGHGGRHYDFFYPYYADEPGTEIDGSDPDDEWIFFYGSMLSLDYADWSKTAVTEETLSGMIAPIPTARKIIIMDACNTGGFIGTSPDTDIIPQNFLTDDNTRVRGLFSKTFSLYFEYPDTASTEVPYSNALVLSAAGELEYSWESGAYNHGVFTYFLLQSAETGDANRDGWVSVDEVYQYTAEQIYENWSSQTRIDDLQYHPHLSGGPVTFALFAAP